VLGTVISMLGSNRVTVKCMDGVTRMCRIPGKMKKRIWIREGDVIIIVPWDFQDEKGDVLFDGYPRTLQQAEALGDFLSSQGIELGLVVDIEVPEGWSQTAADVLAQKYFRKAGLPAAEPKWLARWEAMNLYGRIRTAAKGKPLFVLHDGPPYANGEIHSGTGLNKILKDFVIRSQTMLGKDAPYVPGWDCHGLPIEWKIEEQYREAGLDKDAVDAVEFRKECREFAERWIDVQREEFKRLGVVGDWDHPYTTMAYPAEAQIVRSNRLAPRR